MNKKHEMKNRFFIGCLFVLALCGGVGCKQDLPVSFSQNNALYFGPAATISGNFTGLTQFSFAQYPHRTVDTLMVRVSLLGNISSTDRTFTVATIDTPIANATEGTDYQLQPSYTLPANATYVNIPVILYRSHTLDSTAYSFFLEVVPNQNFATVNNRQAVYNVQATYLQKPSTWDVMPSGVTGWAKYSNNLGTWTKTKYQVVLNALYSQTGDTSIASFPYAYSVAPAIYTQYLQMVKNYILANYPGNYSKPLGVGPTLTDPDANNAYIQVGPANY